MSDQNNTEKSSTFQDKSEIMEPIVKAPAKISWCLFCSANAEFDANCLIMSSRNQDLRWSFHDSES